MKKGIRILAGFAFGAVATAAPERLVTLGASVTEMVFALGAGDAVVARDDSSLYPPEVAERPSVGYFRTIGAEGVLSTRPGLILAAEATGPSDQVALLERSGVPLVLLEDKPSVEALLENVSRVGEVLDRSEAAAALRARLEADLAALREVAAGLDRAPRIVVLMGGSGNGYMAAYEATAAAALIGMIGG
ncbi:MAG: hemin ABC transporter substrate-binding protein, partial [Opitutales bacterium]